MRYSGGTERSLQVTPDPHYEAVGQTCIHTRFAKITGDAPVSSILTL